MTGLGETLIVAAAAGAGSAIGKWVTHARLRRLMAPLWRTVRAHDRRLSTLEALHAVPTHAR